MSRPDWGVWDMERFDTVERITLAVAGFVALCLAVVAGWQL